MPQAELLRGLWMALQPSQWIALVAASPTIQNQIDTAEAGLGQIQPQCADNMAKLGPVCHRSPVSVLIR